MGQSPAVWKETYSFCPDVLLKNPLSELSYPLLSACLDHHIREAPTPATRSTARVEKLTNVVPVPTAEVEAKGVPAQVDENVMSTGEAENAKDEPAIVVENTSESSQADVEFDSEKAMMGVVAQIYDSGNN
ncbi:hypothetical protein K7X08_021740 [Anisodus acutangulus]|uniref:Uncharacterized protein n=1 Tax=Anisodus acutangulus TaxID=402998 RepID=A0A9Q1REM6_9SOLA|nr:hypothetical protein K7X08_021740 [Anisodus acutangulus]